MNDETIEERKNDLYTIFLYQGLSMAGTFRFGDLLLVTPTVLSQLRQGDVVVFYSSGIDKGERTVIVHRVVEQTADGVLTQGDACALPDSAVVYPSQVLGRVSRVQRGNRSYPVLNGCAGRVWARYVRLRHRILALGRLPYRWLRASGLIRCLVRRLWRPAVACVTLATAQGPVVKYLHNGETVAVWQPETRAYWCRKPYDLVLEVPGRE